MPRIENECFVVEVAEVGSLLSSFYDKRRGEEILKAKNENHWAHQDVIQFPVIGPGPISISGKDRDIGQHGFARFEKYAVKRLARDEVTMSLTPNEENKPLYPFDFELDVTISLVGESIRYRFEVINKGDERMPFMLGSHIGFKVRRGVSAVHMPTDVYLPIIDGPIIPKEERLPSGKDFVIDGPLFKKHQTLVMVNRGESVYKLEIGDGYTYVYHMGSPLTAIWTPAESAEFICIEPWWGNSDYIGRPKELGERDYVEWCEPHSKREFGYSISLVKDEQAK
jgi:galactose mutarotase-like enzyme